MYIVFLLRGMEQGARDWLEEERTKGVKRLEINIKGKNHYVYDSTTHWNKIIKKRVKKFQYIGKLITRRA